MAPWLERDPIPAFRSRLLAEGGLSEADADAMEEAVATAIAEAVKFAQASPWPEAAEAWKDVDG